MVVLAFWVLGEVIDEDINTVVVSDMLTAVSADRLDVIGDAADSDAPVVVILS